MTTGEANELVPHETLELLRDFVSLVIRWNRRISLIGRDERTDIWGRHVLDSAQLLPLAPAAASTWLDLGSGAGFPGLVCAAIAGAQNRPTTFTLVEADGRKAAFLREAARCLSLHITVVEARIEALSLPVQDVVSARALAPLDRLLEYAHPFCHSGSVLLFPKGRQAESELTLARAGWHIRVERVRSRTEPDATILRLSEVCRRP